MVTIISLLLLTTQLSYPVAENRDFPQWMNELRFNAGRMFHAEIKTSHTHIRDYADGVKYNVSRLQSEGSLEKVPDPFEVMHKLFFFNWLEGRFTLCG